MADNKQATPPGNQPGAGDTVRGRAANETAGAMRNATGAATAAADEGSRLAARTANEAGQRGGQALRQAGEAAERGGEAMGEERIAAGIEVIVASDDFAVGIEEAEDEFGF